MMKCKFAYLLLLIFYSSYANAQWASQFVPFVYNGFVFDLEMVNAKTCWGITNEISPTVFLETNNYIKTVDGGSTWTWGFISGAPSTYKCSGIWPLSDAVCYVAMNNNMSYGGGVFKTIDGGSNWTKVSTPTMFSQATSFPDFVYFPDHAHGIVVGDPVGSAGKKFEIYITSDSARTWNAVPASEIPAVGSNNTTGVVNMFTVSQGYLWFGTNYGELFLTRDMGVTWIKTTTGFPANQTSSGRSDLADIAFTDSLHGIAIQHSSSGTLLRNTVDGGKTWSAVTPNGNLFAFDIEAIPQSDILISAGSDMEGDGYGSSFSIDNGMNWFNIDTGRPQTSLDFFDKSNGFSGSFAAADNQSGGMWKYDALPVGIVSHEITKHAISIFPNPTSGDVTIIGDEGLRAGLMQVTDVAGRVIYNENFENLAAGLHLEAGCLRPGIYFISILNDSTKIQQTLIVN